MTYRVPPTVPEMLYPPQVQVENTLRVWAISRWRTARALTEFFLSTGYRHLPKGSPVMFHVEELTNNGYPISLIVRFTNSIDAYNLLGHVFLVWMRVYRIHNIQHLHGSGQHLP
ncbi:Auxin-induced protein 5NG4 [Hordeum vulgare]|nr:Auxin-induced protein 5NG4 [Hordeum vulgare]